MRRVKKVAVEKNFKRCPSCEYTDGFHMVFSRPNEKAGSFRAFLVCPMCSSVFDIGLRIDAATGG